MDINKDKLTQINDDAFEKQKNTVVGSKGSRLKNTSGWGGAGCAIHMIKY